MIRSCLFLSLVFLCALFAAPLCQCQEGGVLTVEGEITSVDWVGGVIVVRWLQEEPTIGYDEIALQVPGDLKIMKGTDTISLEDLNQFDRVAVQYRKSGSIGLPTVISMTVTNLV